MNKFMDFEEEEMPLPTGKNQPKLQQKAAEVPEPTLVYDTKKVENAILVDELVPLAEAERRYIMKVLEHTNGNKSEAAKILGITVKSVYNKLHEYEAGGYSLGVAAIGKK